MFSSIRKYSPKKLLASYLSKTLAEFFSVNPERIETNLVHDAKVVLNQIDVKPRIIGKGLLVSGSISQIEFSWSWDTSSLITDVTLTIQGLSIHIAIVEGNEEMNLNVSSAKKTDTIDADNEEAPSDWKAKYLRQIIDHLTLIVTDATISIHLDTNNDDETSQVVMMQAKDMELSTIQENNTSTLLQSIRLASIEAWTQEENNSVGPIAESCNTKYTILEPFGYQASVQRLSGRRFLDGVLSGLFVQGKAVVDDDDSPHHASSSIRVHAGIRQISGLNRLQQVLLSVGLQDTDSTLVSSTVQPVENERTIQEEADENATLPVSDIKSVFHLPFESMEVVLENETNLRWKDCAFQYCTDGTQLLVDCTGGIWVDDIPVSKDNRWVLDLVSSELLLELPPPTSERPDDAESFDNAQSIITSSNSDPTTPSPTNDDKPFRFDLTLDMFRKLYQGIQAILPQYEEAKTIAEQVMKRQADSSLSSSSPPWTMKSTGPISLRFTGESEIWVQISADSPSLSQGNPLSNLPFLFHCTSTKIDSNAGLSIEIPEIQIEDEGFVVKDIILVSARSMDTVTVLQNLWTQITNIVSYDAPNSSRDVPMGISLAGINVIVKEPAVSIKCGKANARLYSDSFEDTSRFDLHLDSCSGHAHDGSSVAVSDINLAASLVPFPSDVVAIPESILTSTLDGKSLAETIVIPTSSLPTLDRVNASDRLIPVSWFGHIASAVLRCSEISELRVLDVVLLKESARNIVCRFDNGSIFFDCPSIRLQKYMPKRETSKNTSFSIDLPYKVIVSIQKFEINDILWPSKCCRKTIVRCFNLVLEPVFARLGSSVESPGAGVYFKSNGFKSVENSATIEIPKMGASGLLQFDDFSRIGNLMVEIEKVQLAADFSSIDWSGSLEQDPSTVMKLPFAVIPKFDLTLNYLGKMVNINNATIKCDPFEGVKTTTLKNLGSHYIKIVKRRIPYLLLSKTEMAGSNVGDSIGMITGSLLTNTSIIGSTVGVAGRDAVGSALTRGKAARGADSTEKYKFGDLSRGLISSMKSGAKNGAQMRGDDAYQVGDWTAGTAKAAGDYASENRVRLAGAGGSTAGMVAGAALLGPIGLVAGSILGASAARSSMRAISGDPKKEPNESRDSEQSDISISSSTHQTPDLLSSNIQAQYEMTPNNTPNVAANTEAKLIGGVASSDHRAVLVQAQIIEPSLHFHNRLLDTRGATTLENANSSYTAATLSHPLAGSSPYHSYQNRIHDQNPNESAQAQVSSLYSSNIHAIPAPAARAFDSPNIVPNPSRGPTTYVQNSTQQATSGLVGHRMDNRNAYIHQRGTNMAPPQPSQAQEQPQGPHISRSAPNIDEQNIEEGGYRFGDITRGIVGRGRQLDGRDEKSGYKFGDFTRGLFR